jgi:superfamily II DNA or RNA helicase
MKLTTTSPTKSYLSDYSSDDLYLLRKTLTYTNTSIQHLIKRHYKNHFWKSRNPESWEFHLEGLKKDLKRCLVFEDEQGIYIRPGSISYVDDLFEGLVVENTIRYPAHKKMAWKHPPKFTLYPYQEESWTKLLAEKHGNVSLCTGAGKSLIIIKLCRELGLKTCVVVPSKSIFEELLEKFEHYFGKGNVGALGAGKRRLDKKITIAIADSLTNLEEGTGEYEFFANLEVMLADESHTLPSETLESVCHGVLANIPYRFYFSGTQLRNDGSTPLLQSIIGKTVHDLGTEEAVKGGYICPHEFRIVAVDSDSSGSQEGDPLITKRVHLLNNKNIAAFIAKLANAMATSQGKQTLVLCEELNQLAMLVPLLKVPFALAHSEKNAVRLEELGLQKVNVQESIEKFNKNEVKVLITTSCCHVGVNIYPTHSTAFWCGGASPIKVKQAAVGRSIRFGHSNPWAAKCVPKDRAIIYDFDVQNNETLTRHLESRMESYRDSGEGLIKYIRLKT